MQKIGFAEALDSIIANDPRYQRDAYIFLRDALDYTTKQQKKARGTTVRHVAGPELLEGVRQYALKEFGPLVITVFESWGIRACEDIGHMVFNLIDAGVFGKTELSRAGKFPRKSFSCPLRPRCTTNVRRVSRLENEAVLDRMAARLKARPELLDRRRETVEHPFGSIKQWMNQGAFLMRGLDNVRGEFSLTALVYNLRRVLNIVGVGPMTAAVRG